MVNSMRSRKPKLGCVWYGSTVPASFDPIDNVYSCSSIHRGNTDLIIYIVVCVVVVIPCQAIYYVDSVSDTFSNIIADVYVLHSIIL